MFASGFYFERRTPLNIQAHEITSLWKGLGALSKITGVQLPDILSRIHQAAKGQEAFRASIELFVLEYEHSEEATFDYFDRCREYIDRACYLSLAIFSFTDHQQADTLPLAYIARISRYGPGLAYLSTTSLNDSQKFRQKFSTLDASMANEAPFQSCRSYFSRVVRKSRSDLFHLLYDC
jgi:hypothetical protein